MRLAFLKRDCTTDYHLTKFSLKSQHHEEAILFQVTEVWLLEVSQKLSYNVLSTSSPKI